MTETVWVKMQMKINKSAILKEMQNRKNDIAEITAIKRSRKV